MDDRDDHFDVEDVKKVIHTAIESTIGRVDFQHDKVCVWTKGVVETCTALLAKEHKPYKYIINVSIMQRNGAALNSSCSCYYNNYSDGSCTVRWENKTMYCIVTVFGLAV